MLPRHIRIIYLHGFASSPASRKAHFFTERLRQSGLSADVPDLAGENGFTRLTITGQLQILERLAAGEPVILIGSSLGGYLAAHYAAQHQEVERLVLLAPAFHFYHLWTAELGPERMALWRKDGTIPVFHYAAGRELPLGYQFIEDAAHFDPVPDFKQSALIFHGENDAVVPIQYSQEFADSHPNTRLFRLNSAHELTDVLELIWQESRDFLLPSARS